MRGLSWSISIVAILGAGCATQPSNVEPVQQARVYESDSTASALAFDPPVLAGEPRIDLSRDGREPGAFDGFEEGTTTYYFLQSYDLYSGFGGGSRGRGGGIGDYYQRQALSQSYGISTR
jgi:hypothetical protein